MQYSKNIHAIQDTFTHVHELIKYPELWSLSVQYSIVTVLYSHILAAEVHSFIEARGPGSYLCHCPFMPHWEAFSSFSI